MTLWKQSYRLLYWLWSLEKKTFHISLHRKENCLEKENEFLKWNQWLAHLSCLLFADLWWFFASACRRGSKSPWYQSDPHVHNRASKEIPSSELTSVVYLVSSTVCSSACNLKPFPVYSGTSRFFFISSFCCSFSAKVFRQKSNLQAVERVKWVLRELFHRVPNWLPMPSVVKETKLTSTCHKATTNEQLKWRICRMFRIASLLYGTLYFSFCLIIVGINWIVIDLHEI